MKKKYRAIVLPVLLSSLLTACSSGTGTGQAGPKEGGSEPTPPAKPTEPVELIFYSTSGESAESFNGKFGDVIRAKFPDYKISYLRQEPGSMIPEVIMTGRRVDIVYNVFDYVLDPLLNSSIAYDMTDLAKKHGVDLTQFEPSVIDGIRRAGDGKLYMLPTSLQVPMVFYNKNLFNKFGVPYPKDGMSWDEMKATSQKLTRKDGDVQYLGFVGSPQYALKMTPFSDSYLDELTGKSTFERETWKKLIQTIFIDTDANNGMKNYVISKKALPTRLNFTNTQDVAMLHFHSEFPAAVPKDLEKIDWDMAALPTFPELKGVGGQATAVAMSITSMAKNKDAAMEVIKFLASIEAQTANSKIGMMSVLKDDSIKTVFGSGSQFKDKNWKGAYHNKLAPIAWKSTYELQVDRVYAAGVLDAIRGEKDLNTVLRETAEKADKAVAELKAANRK